MRSNGSRRPLSWWDRGWEARCDASTARCSTSHRSPGMWANEEIAAVAEWLLDPRGHRAIGVVYHPEVDQLGNSVPTVLPCRYDAFVFLDTTHALHPLRVRAHPEAEPPETYPSGM